MAHLRFNSFENFSKRELLPSEKSLFIFSENFGLKVFDKRKMQKYLSHEIYEKLTSTIEEGSVLDLATADQVAAALKSWALDNGCTHYTHWFHPLTNTTAEKHDSFINLTMRGEPIENFDGSQLIKQEPDASSFPSGGIRSTFEARGYTVWNPASLPFIFEKTLCIPSIFISYKGESLDFKTPLLKTLKLINEKATKVVNLFDSNVKKVFVTVGLEQEYFLVDEAFYLARPDLVLTGRTLFGHSSAKDQQMQDHYFGAIPPRVAAFMEEFEKEAILLGIPIKTRHNEVAPNQFECSVLFEDANLAVDHNMLLMEIMRRIARKHHLRVLFHEKPFKGINGSAKHTNWSLMTDNGINLLKPGKNPQQKLMFVTVFVNIIKAVSEHYDLLRASIVSAGNEHRLGGHEAPPSIISVYVGDTISQLLENIEKNISPSQFLSDNQIINLKLDIGKIPEVFLDNTDRNRTSPLAFTGNRFEFRAVGASQNPASSLIVLNTIVANQFDIFLKDVSKFIEEGINKDEAILKVLSKYISESKKVIFNGNGYSKQWHEEAQKRGLSNITDVHEALKAYISPKSIELFTSNNIFTQRELEARYEVRLETYQKILQIEARVINDIVQNHIIPALIKYQNLLMDNIIKYKTVFNTDINDENLEYQIQITKFIGESITFLKRYLEQMREERKIANKIEDLEQKTRHYIDKVKPYFDKIRERVDKLERVVGDEFWPLPKYREMLYSL